jgi:hypothetical protein
MAHGEMSETPTGQHSRRTNAARPRTWMDVVRSLFLLFFLAASTSALAQYPYRYAPLSPWYPPNGGPFTPAVQGRISVVDLAGNAKRTQRYPRPRGRPAPGPMTVSGGTAVLGAVAARWCQETTFVATLGAGSPHPSHLI